MVSVAKVDYITRMLIRSVRALELKIGDTERKFIGT